MKTCKKGLHQYPDELKQCPKCKIAYNIERNKVGKGREWLDSPEGKIWKKNYNASQKAKTSKKIWRLGLKGRAYFNSPITKRAKVIQQTKRTAIASTGNLTAQQWENRQIEFNYCCAYCHIKLLTAEDGVSKNHPHYLNMDHIIPLLRNGKQLGQNTLYNIIPACRAHNNSKKEKDVWQWMEEQGIEPSYQLRLILIKAITLHQEYMDNLANSRVA